MAAYGHPGNYVTEVLLFDKPVVNDTTAVSAFVAPVNRGPVNPTRVLSINDVQRYLGGFTGITANDVLLQACYDAFSNGARTMWINRVAGTGAVSATNSFKVGTVAALNLTAANPGAWGNQLYVEVGPGVVAGYFSMIVRLVPTGASITNTQIIDRINDVSLNPADPRYVLSVINNPGNPNANLVASLVGAYTYAAGDVVATSTVIPGGDKLTGGVDGSRDGGPLDAAARQAAVYALDVITSPFLLNMPGINDVTTINMMASFADAALVRADNGQPGRGDVFVIVDGDTGTSPSAVATKSLSYVKSDCAGSFYPWLLIPDPVNGAQGVTKLVPPGPAVIGRFIATDTVKGPFKSPAGVTDGRLNGVLMVDPSINNGGGLRVNDLDTLQTGNVNAIKPIPGYGQAVIFGARTLNSAAVTRYISARRTLIFARSALKQATIFAPFENNDATLWAHLASEADKICRQLMSAGGLKGNTANQAYYVTCDATNNTIATVAAGEVHLDVGLALQRPAEFVVIQIGQFQSSVSIAETTPLTAG